jgi:hypothetical protein
MRTETVTLSILTGGQTATAKTEFNIPGKVVRAALFNPTAPSKPVFIKVEKQSGDLLIDETIYQDWEQRNGSYMDSKKPTEFPTQAISVKAYSNDVQTADYVGYLTFYIEE